MRALRQACVVALALVLFGAAVPTASATATTITAKSNNADPYYYYTTERTNTYSYNCMYFKPSSITANTGSFDGPFYIKATRPGSTVAIAELSVGSSDIGQNRSFKTGGYSCRVLIGKFRLGVRAVGHLSGSNPITAKGTLTYNIRSSYTGGPLAVDPDPLDASLS